MDKYEFNIKVEQIKKMVARSDYETAMKIADTIDWRRVRNINILSMAATIYEKNEEYQEAKDILLLAFERAPIGKRLLYKLAELAIREGSLKEAEDYYREFCDLAPDDPRQYILRYLILGAKGAPVEQLIHTLEQYCNLELDEKWLYELAELYSEAGLDDLCIMTCDKIMLMFGLGKYVDKAMELKIQLAPLTKYQMDLVENRDKYEAKLRAVEQEYRMGGPVDFEEEQTAKADVCRRQEPARRAYEEAAYTREPSVGETGSYGEEPFAGVRETGSYGQELSGGVREPSYAGEPFSGPYEEGPYAVEPSAAVEETYPGEPEDEYENEYSHEYQDGYEEGYEKEPSRGYEEEDDFDQRGRHEEEESEPPRITIEAEDPEQDTTRWMPEEPLSPPEISDEALKARIHEAEVEANLAMEMSKLSESGEYRQELEMAQTRVLTDIRDIKRGADTPPSRRIMIEAETQEQGLKEAIETLKEIHRETGSKSQAAKITGEKLNIKGVFAVSDKLTGKDLIVEQAGVMLESTLQELNQLIARDETGMNVVLIDTAERLAELHRVYPGFAKQFEMTKAPVMGNELQKEPEEDNRPVRHITQPKAPGAQSPRPSALQPVPLPAAGKPESQPRVVRREPASASQPDRRVESEPGANSALSAQPRPGENSAPSAQPRPGAGPSPSAKAQPGTGARQGQPKPAPKPESGRLAGGAAPAKGGPVPSIQEEDLPPTEIPPEPEYDDQQEEMDIDEFAKYACKYAGEIDCSISGKSMLALYERIEIMEEDGIPLTGETAEELIEEAADRAENPSFFKRLTGIFSSKYDKEGLLILKEEHFI